MWLVTRIKVVVEDTVFEFEIRTSNQQVNRANRRQTDLYSVQLKAAVACATLPISPSRSLSSAEISYISLLFSRLLDVSPFDPHADPTPSFSHTRDRSQSRRPIPRGSVVQLSLGRSRRAALLESIESIESSMQPGRQSVTVRRRVNVVPGWLLCWLF